MTIREDQRLGSTGPAFRTTGLDWIPSDLQLSRFLLISSLII